MVENQWLFAIGLGLTGIIPRILPLFALNDKELSPELIKWMSYIPVTIFTALVFSDIFFWNDQFSIQPFENLKLIPTLIVAYISIKADNLFLSMVTGIIAIGLMVWGFT